MIQLDNWSRSRTKNPTPTPTPGVVRNPNPTPPKNLRLLTTPTRQPWLQLHIVADCQIEPIIES